MALLPAPDIRVNECKIGEGFVEDTLEMLGRLLGLGSHLVKDLAGRRSSVRHVWGPFVLFSRAASSSVWLEGRRMKDDGDVKSDRC